MAVGAFLEPLVVVSLLFGGAWFNRNKDYSFREGHAAFAPVDGTFKKSDEFSKRNVSQESLLSAEAGWSRPSSPPSHEMPTLRRRKLHLFGFKKIVTSPNTLVFKDRFLSRVLQKFPFLAEAWYWALIYWVRGRDASFPGSCRLKHLMNACRYTSLAEHSLP